MESNPVTSLLGFWMMLQLFVTLALLAGGIYLMFCLGRAASGLDRMASAMEDWVALQNRNMQSFSPSGTGSTPNSIATTITPPPVAVPFVPAASQVQTEYSQPEASKPDENQF